jgi:hypothetical protein
MLGAGKTGIFTKHSRTLLLQNEKECWSPVCWGSGMKWISIQEDGVSEGCIKKTRKLVLLKLLRRDR